MSIRAEANLSALVDSTEDLIWSVDLDGRLTAFNRAWQQQCLETHGVLPAVGMHLEDFLPPEHAAYWLSLRERARTGGSFRIEQQIPDGHTMELSFYPIVADGEVRGISVFGKDITTQKTNEKALREAEKKYHDIFDGAIEGIFQLSLDGRPLAVNSALARMLGYDSPEEFLASVTDVVQQEWVNPEEHASYVEGMAKNGFVRGLESRLKCKDGSTVWGLITARNVSDADGKLLYQEGFIIDINQRKAVENTLREAEKKYREIFDGALEGIFQTCITGELLTANSALAKMLGYDSPEELKAGVTNVHSQLWADPEERARFRQLIGEQGVVDKFKCRFRRRDGAIRWASLSARRVCDADGHSLYFEGFVSDITTRMEAEAELRESEARYRSTFEQAAVGIAHCSFKGEYLRCNARFAEIAGYPLEEIPTLTVQQMTHPDDLDQSESVRIRLSQGEAEQASMEKRLIRKDGSLTWVKMTTWPQRDSKGRMLYLVSLAEDINDRKAAEESLAAAAEALRLEEERYRTVFQTSIDAIAISRQEDGKFFSVNQAFVHMFGHEREEVLGRTSEELHFWANQQDRQKLIDAMKEGPVCRNLEFQLCRKGGEKFWAMLSTAKIELNGVPCILLVVRDISEAKAAAEALRMSEERYRTVFQTSQDCISITHFEDGRFVEVNQAFLRMFGCARQEVIGRTSQEIGIWTNPGDRKKLLDALRRDSVVQNLEFLQSRKNGETFWVLMSGSVIELNGVPSILLVVRDISEAKAAAEALRLSEERYRTIFQTSIDTIVISRLEDGMYIEVNRAFLDMFGYTREEVIGRTSVELGVWPNPPDRQRLVEELDKKTACRDLEFQFARKNGQKFWALVSGSLIELDGIPSYVLVVRDISDARAAAEALRLSEERYRSVFQTTPDITAINRLSDGKYVECNQAFLDATGYRREEVIGRTSLELGIWASAHDRQAMVEMMSVSSSCRRLEAQFRRKNGEVFWGEISLSKLEIDGVLCLLSVTRDLSFAKAAEDTIRSLAYYDPLTGLPNRRMLLERLAAGAQGKSLRALLMVNLDNFKTLNDTLGHQKGDQLLKEVAERIAACVHEADTVSRLSGDEFVVMAEGLSEVAEEAANQAKTIGERILTSIKQPCLVDGRECLAAASIGVTIFGDQQKSTDDFLQQAHIAMHQAKAAGHNLMRFFSPALQATVNARATMEDDLRQAIKKKQFQLYYQPQVELGHLTGVEALIRWKHPSRGIVPPDEFIPMAEETGLILPLGEWILKTACKQIAAWANGGQPNHFAVAVNISALQFRQPEFVEQVLSALTHSGSNPRTLKLELTESMLAENLDEVIAKMTELKSHGLSFSLDDFGTGYSSLAYLKRLPLDQLKIDRAFVRDMLVDATSGAIAQTILSLGRAMGLSVIAEGVETEEQRGYLTGLGCHSFQGFLVSHPLPLEEFQAFLRRSTEKPDPLKK